MIVISQQFNNQSYIGSFLLLFIYTVYILVIIYFSFTVDEAYFPNKLNPRIKFYNIELKQHRLIFITSYHILLILTTKNCNEIGCLNVGI